MEIHIWEELQNRSKLFFKNGYNIIFIQGGCAFTEYSYSQFFNGCPFNNPETINKISELNPKIIIYGARLPVYVNGTCMNTGKFIEKDCGGYYLNKNAPGLSPEESLPVVIDDIKMSISKLSQLSEYLVILYPIPNHAVSTNEVVLRNNLFNESLSYPESIWQDRVKFSKEFMTI